MNAVFYTLNLVWVWIYTGKSRYGTWTGNARLRLSPCDHQGVMELCDLPSHRLGYFRTRDCLEGEGVRSEPPPPPLLLSREPMVNSQLTLTDSASQRPISIYVD